MRTVLGYVAASDAQTVKHFDLIEYSRQVIYLAGISILEAKMNALRGLAILGKAGAAAIPCAVGKPC